MSPKFFMCIAYLLPVIAGANELEGQNDIELCCHVEEEINSVEEIFANCAETDSLPVEMCTFESPVQDQEFISILNVGDEEEHLVSNTSIEQEAFAYSSDETVELHACIDESNTELLV